MSGYRNKENQKLHFTTDYTDVYAEVGAGMHPGVSIDDFEIIISVERILTVNPFSLDIEQASFDITPEEDAEEGASLAPSSSSEPTLGADSLLETLRNFWCRNPG